MDFQVETKKTHSVVTSTCERLNAANAPELKAELIALNKSNVNNIIIDLSSVKYSDSSGLSAILTANRLCKDGSGKFILCGLHPTVQKLIEIAQLHRVLSISENIKEAEKNILAD
jgi:anti-anti-sigma factor